MEVSTLVVSLIDKACEKTGSDYKTAKSLGVQRQVVSDWRAGRRNPQPEDLAMLASIAGMDPAAWLVRGVLEKHAGTQKGERLAIALGKASVAIGAAIAGVSASAMERCSDVLRCILLLSFKPKMPANAGFFS